MRGRNTINIKQLHDKTGELVRAAGRSRRPIRVTDRGKVVAALVAPGAVAKPRRQRRLLPEYEALLPDAPGPSVLEDLDAVRGER
jgi:antitoxin (DNA-binding transcriptional repressor) of toxin-antitoxin stability system